MRRAVGYVVRMGQYQPTSLDVAGRCADRRKPAQVTFMTCVG